MGDDCGGGHYFYDIKMAWVLAWCVTDRASGGVIVSNLQSTQERGENVMGKTIYKLTRQELLQALADYLSKKYGMREAFKAELSAQVDSKTGAVIVEVLS